MSSRTCTKCGREFPLTKKHFHRDPRYAQGFKSWCRLCCNEITLRGMNKKYATDAKFRERTKRTMRKWRKDHPILARRRNRARKARATAFIDEYLKTHPCVDCGESHPATLEFDHRDPSKKRYAIGSGRGSGILPKSLMKEMEKCDVRCANCHRKRHAREYGHRTAI
jgi:hypothetical protein